MWSGLFQTRQQANSHAREDRYVPERPASSSALNANLLRSSLLCSLGPAQDLTFMVAMVAGQLRLLVFGGGDKGGGEHEEDCEEAHVGHGWLSWWYVVCCRSVGVVWCGVI
jgi:hypothetical protein